jgi:flavin-dependent dehydrogenase
MKVLIAGGGVAGAAAACLLGPDCTLIERERAPHDKICGEFISTEAIAYLRRLGLDPEALGAVPVRAVRLVHGATVAEARLPFPALGLSRRVLDAALLARAEALGATVLRGHAVRRVEDGVAEVAGIGRFPDHAVFLATGKHDLRGLRRTPARPPEDLVGLKMHLRIDAAQRAALAFHVEVIMFRGGYGGLQPVEGGGVNLCLLLDRAVFAATGEDWAGVQAMLEAESPHLATRLGGATPLLARPLSIYRVPYGFVHRPDRTDPEGVFRLGDQAAVIPSFSGDGMSMALHSAFAASAAFRGGGAAAYHRRLRRDVGGQVSRAWTIYRAGRAAPALMTAGARLWPGAMRWAARLTRVPAGALASL